MSAGADTGSSEIPHTSDREEMLDLLEDAVREAHRKVESGRVYDAKNEKVRLQWIRALAYAVGQYRQLVKDKDIEEMHARLDALEGESD